MPSKIKVVDMNGEVADKVEVCEAPPPPEQKEEATTQQAEAEPPINDIVEEPKPKKTSWSRKKPEKTEEEQEPEKAEKPKPKRASRAKKPPAPEPEEVVEELKPVEEEDVEEEKPKTDAKTLELVPCPDCGKKLTARTLKYKHPKVRPVKNPPAEKQKKPEPREPETVEQPIRSERFTRSHVRKEKIQKLIAHAF